MLVSFNPAMSTVNSKTNTKAKDPAFCKGINDFPEIERQIAVRRFLKKDIGDLVGKLQNLKTTLNPEDQKLLEKGCKLIKVSI